METKAWPYVLSVLVESGLVGTWLLDMSEAQLLLECGLGGVAEAEYRARLVSQRLKDTYPGAFSVVCR